MKTYQVTTKSYRCTFVIAVEADSPLEAAKLATQILEEDVARQKEFERGKLSIKVEATP